MDLPREFPTMRGEGVRSLVVREDLDEALAGPLLGQLTAVAWDRLYHAYGPATDVSAQLAAVIAGDDGTRDEAWWNLWGNIHHQGTIYEATVPAVPILVGIAGWRGHPDRAQALLMLREIGAAPGVVVWRRGEDDGLVTDEAAGRRLFPELRAALESGAAPLLDGWREDPPDVQRALLWLLSVLPDLQPHHDDLVGELLPEQHRHAWDLEIAGAVDTQDEADAVYALEAWVHGG